jgi:hypothetical protein
VTRDAQFVMRDEPARVVSGEVLLVTPFKKVIA